MHRRLLYLLIILFLPIFLLKGIRAYFAIARANSAAETVIISEIAWMGTAADPNFGQWLELYNFGEQPVDISGWQLIIDNQSGIILNGELGSHAFYLLEKHNEWTVSDIQANQIFGQILNVSGSVVRLVDEVGATIDTANILGGEWPAGEGAPHFLSMERLDPMAPDIPDNWVSNDMIIRNGLDELLNPINGTPKQPNSSWQRPMPLPDIEMGKWGPEIAAVNNMITYTIEIKNNGAVTATGVIMTDTLPPRFIYKSDNSGWTTSRPQAELVVWEVGDLPAGTGYQIEMGVISSGSDNTVVTNLIQATTTYTETDLTNNHADADTLLVATGGPIVLIDAVLYDGYEIFDPEEAIRLINVGPVAADLDGWSLSDGQSTAIFPANLSLSPGKGIWIARQAEAFSRHFGHSPDYELHNPGDPAVPNIDGRWPELNNDGDAILLSDSEGVVQDLLVYEMGDNSHPGWSGPSLEPFTSPGLTGVSGQIVYRMRDQVSGLPVPDTDRALDWAQSTHDPINGRKIRYPGWDLDQFFFTHRVTETAEIIVAIAPDNAYALVTDEIDQAKESIQLETHTFRSADIAEALITAAQRGVSVTVLLEANPVGGVDEQQRINCLALESNGGRCWAMASIVDHLRSRYSYLHAKFILIDDSRVVIGTENLSPDSMPAGVNGGTVAGRRGVLVATNAPGVVAGLQAIWQADFNPLAHRDLYPWPETARENTSGFSLAVNRYEDQNYRLRYIEPSRFFGTFGFELIQSPENSLRDRDGLLGLLARAGEGDTILVQQLNEQPYWGPSLNPNIDPNPRLEAYIAAAQRGATVRLMLDDYFEGDRATNAATCLYTNEIALSEQLDLICIQANPAGLGLHSKVILVRINGQGTIHVGSVNGTELSNKGNREVALQVQSDAAFTLLADMFYDDWPDFAYFPVIFNRYAVPANHILISEVLYDPEGDDAAEFIELVNPTDRILSLNGYSLGDALEISDFEDVRRFPSGVTLMPGETIVVATTATAFHARYGFNPSFEIWSSDPSVPDLVDDASWGDPDAILQLGNGGDEVILRNSSDEIVDAMAYGSGHIPGVITCPLVTSWDHSLERYPYWGDSDDCTRDFREWPFPNPGSLP